MNAVIFNTEIKIKIIKHFFRLLFISVKILFFILLLSCQIFIYRSALSQVSHLYYKRVGQSPYPYSCLDLIVFNDAINIRRIAPQSF